MTGFVIFFLLCTAALAQEQPQLVWEGQVDGTSVLRVHGRRTDIEGRQGLPVQRQRARFFEPLPERRQDVRLEVSEGRGNVRILEQPRPENNYTLAVGIEDPKGGSSFYSLAFFWESGRTAFAAAPSDWGNFGSGRNDGLWWSGRVDGEAVVSCRGNRCEAEAQRGQPVLGERFRFSHPLPMRDTVVSLDRTEGRGEIRLLEQPREQNGYTARVLIRDSQGGSSDYAFSLVWAPPRRDESGFAFSRRGLLWSGRVDGRIRVVVEGRRASAEVISGAPVTGARADFARDLPGGRPNPNVTIRRVRGRGRVELVESPSPRNGYRIVFEINDTDGGADNYEVEVGW